MKGRLVVHRFKCGDRRWHKIYRVRGYRGVDGQLYDKVSAAWIATKQAPTEELEFVRKGIVDSEGNPLDRWDQRGHLTYDAVSRSPVDPLQDEMRDPQVQALVKQAMEAK